MVHGFLPCCLAGLLAAAGGAWADDSAGCAGVRVELIGDPNAVAFDANAESLGAVAVEGLPPRLLRGLAAAGLEPADWRRLLAIYTGDPPERPVERPAVLGDYAVDGERLVFRPRFPFVAGLSYRAFVSTGAGVGRGLVRADRLCDSSYRFSIPMAADDPPTAVTAIYPSAEIVPANLLRLYVHFSAPMRGKDVHRHVRLVDVSGLEVEMAFVEVEHGLWDPEHRRLTLFLHPGRIKRGIAAHDELGPPLRPGETYHLIIDRELSDARGRPLESSHVKVLRAGAEDRVSPAAAGLGLRPPRRGTDRLRLELPEPLDHALLHRMITVVDGDGELVAGAVTVGDDETELRFAPARAWTPGRYRIRVQSGLEDLAGNTFDRLFDVESGKAPASSRVIELAFWIQ